MMKSIAPILICLILWSPTSYAESSSLALSIGRSTLWPVGRGTPITVSNGAVVRANDLGSTVKITALKLGHAVIKAGEKSLEVAVLPEAGYRAYEALNAATEGRRGLRLDFDSGSLAIRGTLLRWSDWSEIADLSRNVSENAFRFEATIEPSLREQVAAELNKRITKAGLAPIDFSFEPAVVAHVPLEPKDLRERASRVLAPFGIQAIASSGVVSLEPLVRVKILVAEFRKKAMSRIGMQWPAAVDAQLLPSLNAAPGGLALSMNALESNGLGKILASPTLLCRSGKEAEFLAGGEFPIKVSNYKSHEVIWKQYGVLLKIQPLADRAGRMSIGITTEVSMIDSTQTVDGIPGLLTNRIQTHFDLSSPRTIALSGLIKKEWGEAIEGLPGLSKLPILGPLFGSRDYRDQETELVVFVTPEIERSSGGAE